MQNEEELLQLLKLQVSERIDLTTAATDAELMTMIEQVVFTYSRERYLTSGEKQFWVRRLFHSFRGLDILQPLVDDRTITEIMVNRFDEIFIEREGEVVKFPGKFESPEKLEDIIQIIVSKVNRVVNESTPIVDARLKDGSRVNAVLPPIALKGPSLTVRKFPDKPLTMDDLIEKGAITSQAALFLQTLVKAKCNIFIGGGTGSGKTTFLNVLSSFIPADERIVTIEDSAELQIRNVPNLVSLETRNANTEGRGEVSIRDLIRSSLRMRPNRIIVGEVRGSEALDMLQAMNTGHDGSLSTGHANSAVDMLSRLETMVLSGAELPIEVVRKQIVSAIDILIHLTRLRDRSRRVTEIHEVVGLKNGEIELNPLFQFVEEGTSHEGKVIGALKGTGNRLTRTYKLQMSGLSL